MSPGVTQCHPVSSGVTGVPWHDASLGVIRCHLASCITQCHLASCITQCPLASCITQCPLASCITR